MIVPWEDDSCCVIQKYGTKMSKNKKKKEKETVLIVCIFIFDENLWSLMCVDGWNGRERAL